MIFIFIFEKAENFFFFFFFGNKFFSNSKIFFEWETKLDRGHKKIEYGILRKK